MVASGHSRGSTRPCCAPPPLGTSDVAACGGGRCDVPMPDTSCSWSTWQCSTDVRTRTQHRHLVQTSTIQSVQARFNRPLLLWAHGDMSHKTQTQPHMSYYWRAGPEGPPCRSARRVPAPGRAVVRRSWRSVACRGADAAARARVTAVGARSRPVTSAIARGLISARVYRVR